MTAERPLPEDNAATLSDRIGLLPERTARPRKNPIAEPLREIVVRISTGKVIRILSNDLDAPASEIADSTGSAGRSNCSSNGSSRT